MTREEIIKTAKPILFKTEMVRAILDGRKTVTRRVMKPQLPDACPECMHIHKEFIYDPMAENVYCARCGEPLYNGGFPYKAPYQPGDILYVRETFCPNYFDEGIAGYRNDGLRGNRNAYKADYHKETIGDYVAEPKWKPSIHMPKEAARIFLRVTNVRVERLRDITNESAIKEGFEGVPCTCQGYPCTDCMGTGWIEPPKVDYMYFWDTTIKKSDLDRYGWDANPWVWVIEFERVRADE